MPRKTVKAKKTREVVGVTFDRITGSAHCPHCGFKKPRILRTCPWEGEGGSEVRVRYHLCQSCGKGLKSIEENVPVEGAA
jgi:predicted RNA-binding Zn-ribbon protein involved in translation (DUF1610 family)